MNELKLLNVTNVQKNQQNGKGVYFFMALYR